MKTRKETNPYRHAFLWWHPSQTFYQYSPSLHNSCSQTLAFHWLILYWFLSIFFCLFSLVSGKMGCEKQIPLLKHDVQYVMWYGGFDNSITVLPYHKCLDKIGDQVLTSNHECWQAPNISDRWIHNFAFQSWSQQKMHSRLLPFSHVWTVIAACLTIADQYSVK